MSYLILVNNYCSIQQLFMKFSMFNFDRLESKHQVALKLNGFDIINIAPCQKYSLLSTYVLIHSVWQLIENPFILFISN